MITNFLHRCFDYQLDIGIAFLRLFKDDTKTKKVRLLCSQLPERTIGHILFHALAEKGHDFVPGYENHDSKHIILGYQMHPEGEMKMQAFMFGNAGFNWFTVLSFLSFIIYVPQIWHELPYHYQLGKLTKPIVPLDILDIASCSVEEIRDKIGLEEAKRQVILHFTQSVYSSL